MSKTKKVFNKSKRDFHVGDVVLKAGQVQAIESSLADKLMKLYPHDVVSPNIGGSVGDDDRVAELEAENTKLKDKVAELEGLLNKDKLAKDEKKAK